MSITHLAIKAWAADRASNWRDRRVPSMVSRASASSILAMFNMFSEGEQNGNKHWQLYQTHTHTQKKVDDIMNTKFETQTWHYSY